MCVFNSLLKLTHWSHFNCIFQPAALIPWHRPCPGSAHCSCLRSWAPRHHCRWECPWKFCSSDLFNVGHQTKIILESRCKNWLSNLLKYISELIEALPWNLLRFASLVSWKWESFNLNWHEKLKKPPDRARQSTCHCWCFLRCQTS